MQQHEHRIALLALLLAAAAGTCAASPAAEKAPALRSYEVSQNTSPFYQSTDDSAENQPGYVVAAVPITDAMGRFPKLSAYALDGEPLLASDKAGKRTVLNGRFFGEMIRPAVTSLTPGKRVPMGVVKEARLRADPTALFSFLVESELINSYLHLGANLDLVSVKESGATVTGSFRGTHVYYTSYRNERSYEFDLVLDRNTGLVEVVEGK